MIATKSIHVFALLALVAALALAGCGGDGNSGSAYGGGGSSSTGTQETTAPATAKGGAAVLTVASVPKVGTILVDAAGFTVYDFHKDKGTTSSCYGACAKVWPPLTTTDAPKAGKGAMASKLGTTKRKDGTVQVTYAGHPLYTYVTDKQPGEANGQDIDSFGAEWYALRGSGAEAEG